MQAAAAAIVQAARDRGNSKAHYVLLGNRDLTPDDLAATLLLAVHTTLTYNGAEYSFVMTCQIGDGMTAAVCRSGPLYLLGEADSGEFSGETEFLTSAKKLTVENLRRKTYPFFSPLAALLVMTDGVADDYFPNDPELLRLQADLVLNAIVPGAAASTAAPAAKNPTPGDSLVEVERLTSAGAQKIVICSAAKYAAALGVELTAVKGPEGRSVCTIPLTGLEVRDKDGSRPLAGIDQPEQRLLAWLDSYQVRGSFDDRTLVILHPAVK